LYSLYQKFVSTPPSVLAAALNAGRLKKKQVKLDIV
jgi:hypothetical protein